MKASVLSDARLVRQAGRFVWLSIDAERERNAAFLEAFPTTSYPTFLVIDAASGQPVLRWYGSASVRQLERLLDDALVALRAAGGAGPEAALARADRLHAAGKAEEAAAAYREALAAGGPSWLRRPRAAESLVAALLAADRAEDCAAVALAEGPGLPEGSSRAWALTNGLSCALDAEGGPPWRGPALDKLEPLVRDAARTRDLLADDRAGILEVLSRAREEAGDARGARDAARRLWTLLEAEARRAPSVELRASLDSYRVGAALALKRPGLAVPALRASERALPDDYNPPYRLAILYREMGRQDAALAAADRALARAYGPRKLRVYDAKAASLARKGDRAGLEATLAEAVAFAGTLPPVQVQGLRRLVEGMRARLEKARE
jgi:thioredoxin-like negative regulator of GroEL